MEAHLQSLIGYFSAHPHFALGAVFAGSFLEALAVIGTIIPGSSVVFVAGALVGLRVLDPWPVAAVAVAGAILGDGISFWLGHRYHDAIREMWPLRKFPKLLERGQAYFAANGGKSVFLGRFLGPVRAIVPVVAGMSDMRVSRFYTMNVLSALAWAAAHLLPGVLFGASLELAGAVSSRLVALVAVIVVGLWLITQVTRLAIRWGWPYVNALRDRVFVRASATSGPIARAVLPLLDPARRESLALLVSATLLVGGAWLFLGVVEDVVTNDTLVGVDRAIYAWLQGLRTRWGDDVMVTVTQLGSAYVMIPVIAAVGLWFAITRRFRTLAYWIAAAAFAQLLVWALKYGLGRARPPTAYAAIDEYSFPSGHAALSMVVYGFLAFLLGHRKPGWQQTAFALGAIGMAVLVAFSRLYLGAHWFSDVIASFGLGVAWIALLAIAYIHHVRERTIRATPVLLIVLATLTFVGGSYAGNHHQRDLARYARPVQTRTLRVDAWRSGEWMSLPTARTEIDGQQEEPFAVQWVATRTGMADALTDAGWESPARWRSAAVLLWLLPSTPVEQLPVLPKFHQGQPAALTFIRPIDARTRTVIRLWRVAAAIDDASPPRTLPLWTGMITTERSRSEWRLITVARTASDAPAPEQALAEAVHDKHIAVETRSSTTSNVLLIW
ncbi:MAG: phosphatase PAP2 family protein [Pseudomonadota bacterium]|nr:phosphatase PAP2 family protein [Pseudomonadota bacterium]